MKTNILYVAGTGPGSYEKISLEVINALSECDIIIGYKIYVELLRNHFPSKEFVSTPMTGEEERCRIALEYAQSGRKVVFVCSGDSGVYGLAGLLYELKAEYKNVDIKVLPGITAALSGAALLGAPLVHDFCVISLSDVLTPWNKIEKRIVCAAEADFGIVIYNPSSHLRPENLRNCCEILNGKINPKTPCGIVRNIGRKNESINVCLFSELGSQETDMFCTVFIGNSSTKIIDGKIITPRGYDFERKHGDCK